MSDKTGISWTESTWNPVTGCTKESPACKHCYALRNWPRLSANPKTVYFGRDFTDVAVHPERLDQPIRWTRPRRIFVNSMSDLFHEDVPEDFIDKVFAVMAIARQHQFQVLTKRAGRMRDYLCSAGRVQKIWAEAKAMVADLKIPNMICPAWPFPNVWMGVSVEDQEHADKRIPLLLSVPAAVRWVSAEPLLGPVDLRFHIFSEPTGNLRTKAGKRQMELRKPADGGLHWVVAEAESGRRARPMDIEWARTLRDQCITGNVPFFTKQLSAGPGKVISDPAEFPEDLRIQQYPLI